MHNDAPFIKLLKTINGFYFFDVNRNEIVRVSPEVHALLDRIVSGDIALLSHPYIASMIERGYLSNHHPKEIKHPMTDIAETLLDRKMSKITLQLTQDCNFRCSYCPYSGSSEDSQRIHKPASMTWETVQKAIDFFYTHSLDAPSVNIGFYGGEPLLEFSLMRSAVAYAKKRFTGKHLLFNVTTNGSILSDPIIEFMIENEMVVLISIDGPEEIHDSNRTFAKTGRGTFRAIAKNLHRALSRYPTFAKCVSYNMVIDPENNLDCVNKLFSDASVFNKQRTKAQVFEDRYTDKALQFTQAFITQSRYERFLAYLSYFDIVDGQHTTPLGNALIDAIKAAERRATPIRILPDSTAPGGPCIPGIARAMVDVHGSIYPCERCSETCDAMRIGSLDAGYDIEKVKSILNIGAMTADRCKNCWAFSDCQICAAHIEDGDGFSFQKKLSLCEDVQNIVERKLLSRILVQEVASLYLPRRGVDLHAYA